MYYTYVVDKKILPDIQNVYVCIIIVTKVLSFSPKIINNEVAATKYHERERVLLTLFIIADKTDVPSSSPSSCCCVLNNWLMKQANAHMLDNYLACSYLFNNL